MIIEPLVVALAKPVLVAGVETDKLCFRAPVLGDFRAAIAEGRNELDIITGVLRRMADMTAEEFDALDMGDVARIVDETETIVTKAIPST